MNAKERVESELEALEEKMRKLKDFQTTEKFKNLSIPQRDLLGVQYKTMKKYAKILRLRIALWED